MNDITENVKKAVESLLDEASLARGEIFVVGCSSSEVAGKEIGSSGSEEIAQQILEGMWQILRDKDIYLAAQCCEHLNRALVVEKQTAIDYNLEIVNVVPKPNAGGSFASAVYKKMEQPVVVENIKAHAGIDIGLTLIGMHLKSVAVPVRLAVDKIGKAKITCAKTRPKYIGGPRAHYK